MECFGVMYRDALWPEANDTICMYVHILKHTHPNDCLYGVLGLYYYHCLLLLLFCWTHSFHDEAGKYSSSRKKITTAVSYLIDGALPQAPAIGLGAR